MKNFKKIVHSTTYLFSLLILFSSSTSLFAQEPVTANFNLKGNVFFVGDESTSETPDLGEIRFYIRIDGDMFESGRVRFNREGGIASKDGVFSDLKISPLGFTKVNYDFSVPLPLGTSPKSIEVVFRGRSRNGILLVFTNQLGDYECRGCGLTFKGLDGDWRCESEAIQLSVSADSHDFESMRDSITGTSEGLSVLVNESADGTEYLASLSRRHNIFPIRFEVSPIPKGTGGTIVRAESQLIIPDLTEIISAD